jgi:hypothetical protein
MTKKISAPARSIARATVILGFCGLPLTAALQAHVVSFPPPWQTVARSGVAVGAVGLVIVLALRAIAKSWDAATVAAAFWLAFFAAYPAFAPDTRTTDGHWFALFYLAVASVLAGWLTRLGSERARRLVDAAAVGSIVIVAVGVIQIAPAYTRARPSVTFAKSLLADRLEVVERPDVYHIVLDGFGRPDVLRALYGADLGAFVATLQERGFDMTSNAVTNYVQTYLSLASMLNADYLTPLALKMGDSHSREPLHEMIQSSVIFGDFKRLGYEITFLGSPYSATFENRQADTCFCGVPLMGEFEATLIARTPVRDLPMGDLLYGGHRQSVVETFATLRRLPPGTRPRLVFAHIMSPHPPFVFDRNGTRATPRQAFGYWDATMFQGSSVEYRHGYGEQVQFLARQVLTVVDHILSESPRPVVIIIQGDHGPRYRFDQSDATRTDALESVPILLAVRWADTPRARHEVSSPVNLYREFIRRYTNAEPPLLEDAAFVSSFATPYRLLQFAPSTFRDAAMRAADTR